MKIPSADGPLHRWENQEPVRECDHRGIRRLWSVALCVALSLLPAASYLTFQNRFVEAEYGVSRLRAESESLRRDERRLEVLLSEQQSPPQVEEWATGHPRLVPPTRENTVVVTWAENPGRDLVASHRATAEAAE